MNPFLSIITINQNNAEGLERTIQSVVQQSVNGFEYLVIDGGSTDGSKEIINKYKDRISLVISEPDHGIYHAMNKGIFNSSGKHLLFLNSGDELINSNIIEQATPLISDEDIIFGDLVIATNHSEEIKQYPDQLSFKYFLTDSLPHPATFIKRELFKKTNGYDESLQICSDWAFFIILICKHHASYKHIPVVLSKFYLDGISSSMNNIDLMASERKRVIEEHFHMYVDLVQEWEEGKNLRFIFKNSRLIKIAQKLGFLKPPLQ